MESERQMSHLQQECIGGSEDCSLVVLIVQQTSLRFLHSDALACQTVAVRLARHGAVADAETGSVRVVNVG